jgi:hypothetical protein
VSGEKKRGEDGDDKLYLRTLVYGHYATKKKKKSSASSISTVNKHATSSETGLKSLKKRTQQLPTGGID